MLYCLARQMIELERPECALDLTQTGLYAIRRVATPRVAAMLYAMEGRAYGCMGDASSCRRSLAGAAEEFTAGSSMEPDWTSFFSPAEFAGITGAALRDLALQRHRSGDEQLARTYARQAQPWIHQAAEGRSPDYLRSQVLDLDGYAVVSLLVGEPESATAALQRAFDLVTRVSSARVERNLHRTVHLGQTRYPDLAAIREVADHARTVLPEGF